jgi:hypothetical protein
MTQRAYEILLSVFVSYLMITTKCSQEAAIRKISDLCAIADSKVGQ